MSQSLQPGESPFRDVGIWILQEVEKNGNRGSRSSVADGGHSIDASELDIRTAGQLEKGGNGLIAATLRGKIGRAHV